MKANTLIFSALFLSVSLLQACGNNNEENYDVEWGEQNMPQIRKFEENNVPYELNDGIIYIREQDLNKAQNCCS